MKNNYFILFFICALSLNAQTTVDYPQRTANYDAFFTDGGGNFDSGSDQFGMWANFNAKQSAAWRNFTDDGTTAGTPTTMAVGDEFTITVSATQASFGVIGLALLSSPTATASWDDRINNYAVQVNLNGNGGANDPWEVVSSGGTVDASNIGGSTSYSDFKFTFTLNSATTMTVSINDGAETFNVTLNNTDITGYSIYFADDWNGSANADIFWKPATNYLYAEPLGLETFDLSEKLKIFPNPVTKTFTVNRDFKTLKIYSITGKLVKTFNGSFDKNSSFDIENMSNGMYLIQLEDEANIKSTLKLIKA